MKHYIHLKRLMLFAGVLIFVCMGAYAQSADQVTGTVSDVQGNPLGGVMVLVEGTTAGTITNAKGDYTIRTSGKAVQLTFSYIGYVTQTVNVMTGTRVDVVLEEELLNMDEVVVVGYGTMKKSHLTGAVASVKAEQLSNRPVADIGQALAGQIAGVDIGSVTTPGATPRIRIRGNRSIGGENSPLIVVDGIPRESFDDIPVSEVQSIEVLKDAISTAIYGSRAANGVILITTKSSKVSNEKKTEVGFSGYYGVNFTSLPKMMSGDDYIQYRRDRQRWSQYSWDKWGSGAALTDAEVFNSSEIATVQNRNFVDWNNLLYDKTAATQDYNLYIDNSSKDTRIRFSAGYHDEKGYYKYNDFSRLTLGLNVEQKLFKIFDFNTNIRYSNLVKNDVDPGLMYNTATNTLDVFRYISPLVQAYDEDGNLIEEILSPYANPLLDRVHKITDKTIDHNLFSVMNLKVKLYKGLTFTSNFGYDLRYRQTNVFYPANSTKRYMLRETLGAFAKRKSSNRQRFTFDNILNYSNTFGKHAVDATVVASIESQVSQGLSQEGNMLPEDVLGYWNMSHLTLNKEIGSSYSKRSRASFIGRFQYAYDDRYIANFSLRHDGSSVLSPGHKWGTFPAGSVAWVLSKEKFFHSNVVSNLKLRASYGMVASDSDLSPYQSFGSIAAIRTNFGNEFADGYTLSDIDASTRRIPNKALGWEKTSTLNIGLDWSLWEGRLSGYIEYYKAITTDLIFEADLPTHTAFTATWENIGSTANRGVEVNLRSINIATKAFRWSTDINFATNKSWVRSLKNGEDQPGNKLFIGQPWRMYYDNVLLGIWQIDDPDRANYVEGSGTTPGQLKYKDISGPEGVPDGIINDNDYTVLGVTDPKWSMYMRNTFSYKNLTLTVGLMGKFGHMITLNGRGWQTSYPLAVMNDYWTPDRPEGKYNIITINENSVPTALRYRSGDYIRMQELSLSYHLPLKSVVKSIDLGIVANNPFYIWRKAKDCVDPSAPDSAWQTWKSVVFKMDIKF